MNASFIITFNKTLGLGLIILLLACNNDSSNISLPKANVKFYKKNNTIMDDGALLIINDSNYYVYSSISGFNKYNYSSVVSFIKDTVFEKKHYLKFRNDIYAFIDSTFISKSDLILDTVSLSNFSPEQYYTLDLSGNQFSYLDYIFHSNKLTEKHMGSVDSSFLIGLNYVWQLIKKEKLRSYKSHNNVLWVLTKDSNIETYTFPDIQYGCKINRANYSYFSLFKEFLFLPLHDKQ